MVENTAKRNQNFFWKNHYFFRQINVFDEEINKELIHGNFLSVIAFHSNFSDCATEKKLIELNTILVY